MRIIYFDPLIFYIYTTTSTNNCASHYKLERDYIWLIKYLEKLL